MNVSGLLLGLALLSVGWGIVSGPVRGFILL